MPPRLLGLPDDVLISVFTKLDVQSLLSLHQTCRVLHAFCSSDYIWHHIDLDLPLNIPNNSNEGDLKGAQLRLLAAQALRVDQNWSRVHSRVNGIHCIHHGGMVSEMQLLSSEWLVTLSRASTGTSCVVEVWHIRKPDDVLRVRVITLEAQYSPKFSAWLRNDSREMCIAICFGSAVRQELLRVYVFPLHNTGNDSPSTLSRYLVKRIIGRDIRGIAYELHVNEGLVALALAQFNNILEPPRYQIYLLDMNNGREKLLDIQVSAPLSQMHFRLFSGYLAMTGIQEGNLIFRQYVISTSDVEASERITTQSIGTPCQKLVAPLKVTSSPGFDYTLSADAHRKSLRWVTTVSFNQSPPFRHVVKFPLNTSDTSKIWAHRLTADTSSAVDIMCVGQSGRRMVWLERRWDTDTFVLMKGHFPSNTERGGKAIVGPLVPPHTALPFEFHACQSLAFDEATGRVCVGLHTGDLYLLDF
ncbi:hypothetical protein WG66_016995 [Moniliophthora roreri]|uniref:F-box domain-containing protein n=1 Tax=Moniliophthora roreri TaxID=221103 RepID=A0A0W0EXU3_MONRR|nr:hypothetical protein WG66_016995 [Moniliophthora roreri]